MSNLSMTKLYFTLGLSRLAVSNVTICYWKFWFTRIGGMAIATDCGFLELQGTAALRLPGRQAHCEPWHTRCVLLAWCQLEICQLSRGGGYPRCEGQEVGYINAQTFRVSLISQFSKTKLQANSCYFIFLLLLEISKILLLIARLMTMIYLK